MVTNKGSSAWGMHVCVQSYLSWGGQVSLMWCMRLCPTKSYGYNQGFICMRQACMFVKWPTMRRPCKYVMLFEAASYSQRVNLTSTIHIHWLYCTALHAVWLEYHVHPAMSLASGVDVQWCNFDGAWCVEKAYGAMQGRRLDPCCRQCT